MASLNPQLSEGINKTLVDVLIENYERYYRFTYSLVKNEEQTKNIIAKTAYFSLHNGRKLKSIPKTNVWFFQLIQKDGMRKMYEFKKYKRDMTKDSQLYAYMETIEPSAVNCFKLYYFEELSIEDVSEITRYKPGEVKQKLKEVRMALKINPDLQGESWDKMAELIDVYESVPIPDDLEDIVMDTIKREKAEFDKEVGSIGRKRITKPLLLVVMIAVFIFGTLYLAQHNTMFAEMVADFPILGKLFAPFIN